MAQQRELLQEFKAWMTQAIHDNKLFTEVVTWDVGLMGLPNQQGGIIPILGIYMAIPGLVLGEQVVTWNMLPANSPINEEIVRDFVRQSLDALQDSRSNQIQEALKQDSQQEAKSGGLILS